MVFSGPSQNALIILDLTSYVTSISKLMFLYLQHELMSIISVVILLYVVSEWVVYYLLVVS